MHPREDNNWYLHRCPITDIYTAAHPVQISVIAGTTFLENYFFFNIFFWILFSFLYIFLFFKKIKLNRKGDISREIFLVFPICHENEQIMRIFFLSWWVTQV